MKASPDGIICFRQLLHLTFYYLGIPELLHFYVIEITVKTNR